MDFMNSIKILVAPYIILLALLVHILTGDEIYLFIAGSLILLFLLIFLVSLYLFFLGLAYIRLLKQKFNHCHGCYFFYHYLFILF